MAAADGTAKSVAESPSTEAAIIGTDVTGRQRMEESLRLTQFSVEHAADSISWLTRDGRFVDVNESFCRHLGYSRADLLNMAIGEVNLTRTPENWSRHWERVRQLGSLTFEVEHRRADGGPCQMEVTANHVVFGGNEYHCSFARDITERKREQEELAKSERHFRSVIEHAADAIYVVTRDEGKILVCNQQALTDTGYSREELLGMSASDLEVSKAGGEVDAVHMSLKPKVALTVEGVHRRKDGSTFPVEVRFGLLEEDDPQLILSIVRDITERKKVEEALRMTQLSVDQAGDLIHWLGSDGRVLYVSDSMCRRYGYSREELLGMSVEDITVRMLPEEWSARWELIKAQGSVTFEREHRTKSGETFPVEITATHFEYAGRDHNCAFVRDITELKQVEEALRESEARTPQHPGRTYQSRRGPRRRPPDRDARSEHPHARVVPGRGYLANTRSASARLTIPARGGVRLLPDLQDTARRPGPRSNDTQRRWKVSYAITVSFLHLPPRRDRRGHRRNRDGRGCH